MSLQIVVGEFAVRIGPREIEDRIVVSEFDRVVGVHQNLRRKFTIWLSTQKPSSMPLRCPTKAQWPPSSTSRKRMLGFDAILRRVSGRIRINGSLAAWTISAGTEIFSTTLVAEARS